MKLDSWLAEEIEAERRAADLASRDGKVYSSERLHTLLEVRAHRAGSSVNPDYRPDHDSLFMKFEQLWDHVDAIHDRATFQGDPGTKVMAAETLRLVEMIRGMVLK